MSLPILFAVTSPSELVTKADAGIVRRGFVAAPSLGDTSNVSVRLEEAARETVLRLRPHHAGVHVHVPGEAPIDHERDGIDRAGALGGPCIRTTSNGTESGNISVSRATEAVLPLVVIRTGDVEGRRDRIFHTEPGRLQDLVVGEVGVVDRTIGTEDEATGGECTGVQRIVRVGIVDVLIATEQFPRSDDIPDTDRKHGVVGNRGPDLAQAGTYRGSGCGKL